MSRDYHPNVATTAFEKQQEAGGWFTFNHAKLRESQADFWSLILVSRERRSGPFLINIPPAELLRRLESIFGVRKTYQSYPWVLHRGKPKDPKRCIEGRGLKKEDKAALADGHPVAVLDRDLTKYYENWTLFE